ncbi:MAG: GAF domain-containing protein [Novosphingobium sp.]|nr:GAF domain-containing protein [Novosphingobium sp.]
MSQSTFIRATEIWTPSSDGKHLDLTSGLYGDLEYFEAISRGMRFAYGEGLPGRTWAEGHPIVLKSLNNSYFMRGDAAMTEGLSCAVSVPIFTGDQVSAVIVFFCGDDRFHVGALELWSVPENENEMALVDGYFGRAQKFEFTSRNTRFPRAMGLPGKVWATGQPVIMDDLGRGNMFLRRDAAEKVGINRAIGFPCAVRGEGNWVLTFLSARNSPIARRFECWVPDGAGALKFESGYCESGKDMTQTYANTVLSGDTGVFGQARKTRAPVISRDVRKEASPVGEAASEADLSDMVAMLVYADGEFRAILAWFL